MDEVEFTPDHLTRGSQAVLSSETAPHFGGVQQFPLLPASQEKLSRDADPYAWLLEQANELRLHQPNFIDWAELAEELEDIVAVQRAKVVSLLAQLEAHLLKWQFSRFRRSEHSWQKTLNNTRTELGALVAESTLLRKELPALRMKAYKYAPKLAGDEMRLTPRQWQALFPPTCPYAPEELLDFDFVPELAPTANGRG